MTREIGSAFSFASRWPLRARLAPLAFALVPFLAWPDAAGAAQTAEQGAQADPSELRICAAANELPYSNRDEAGFENKIAKTIADAMGRKARFVWLDKPGIYIVRDLLNQKRCDVVVGLDTGDQRVLTTRPYFRTGYVFVQRKNASLKIDGWRSPDLRKARNIGFVDGSPPSVMMNEIDLYNTHFNYMKSLVNFKSRRNQYIRVDPRRMVGEVANGKADVAVAFAPEVARYVAGNADVALTVIADDNKRSDGKHVPHHFNQSMGVRKGDTALLSELNKAIDASWPQIEAVLKAEGIPMLKITKASRAEAPAAGEATHRRADRPSSKRTGRD